MVFEPDYSKYRMDQLLEVKKHTNPEIYPQRAQRIDEEIARRNRDASSISYSPEKSVIEKAAGENVLSMSMSTELRLMFRGSAREYFRIWIVNLCLTILTLGIFSAWAKVRKKRYFYSHTILDGTPFQYLGQPIPILKGRVIAAIGFLLYYLSSNFFTSLLPYVLLTGLVAAPWVIVRSAAFNARYSAFRNITFHFDGRYMDAMKVIYVWGIIPAIVVGMIFAGEGQGQMIYLGATFALFVLQFPWWIRRLKKFIIEHTSYGGRKGLFFATGGQFFTIYFRSGLIMIAVSIVSGLLAAALFSSIKKSPHSAYLIVILVYVGYVLSYAYVQARSGNLIWNNIQLGPLRFRSTLGAKGLLKLYVTNALGIVASLGLLIPWAVMRTMKYRVDNLIVIPEGDFAEFQGSDISTVAAAGAETLDIFDMDISL